MERFVCQVEAYEFVVLTSDISTGMADAEWKSAVIDLFQEQVKFEECVLLFDPEYFVILSAV